MCCLISMFTCLLKHPCETNYFIFYPSKEMLLLIIVVVSSSRVQIFRLSSGSPRAPPLQACRPLSRPLTFYSCPIASLRLEKKGCSSR